MLNRFLLAAVALVGISAPAAAQGCQHSRAPTVTFAQAASGSVTEPCVEIEGVAVGRLLVEDEQARYRRERVANDPSSTGAVLGFYSVTYFEEPTRVRVVGRLSDCAREDAAAQADAGNDIIMMTGYCHYYRGRTIHALHVEALGPAEFSRLLRADAGDLGNFSPLPDGDLRSRMEAAAVSFLAAVRSGNRALLTTMHGGGGDGRRSTREVETSVAVILDAANSPFAAVRSSSEVTFEIFGWKPPLWADDAWRAGTARTGTADAIACFSERADAAALWPIDSKDADNIPGRPYACTRIHIGSTGMDAPASFDTDQARSGVAEPVR